MVGTPLESQVLETLNSPSEERKVINGVAVVTTKEAGDATGFEIKPESDFVLSGDKVNIKVTAYDENKMPAARIPGKLKWVVTGSGTVENNTFTAQKGGRVQLDLYYDNEWQNTCFINVIDEVYGINSKSSSNSGFII